MLIFKSLKSKFTSKRLANIVYDILKIYNLQDRLIIIIANNVNNNKILQRALTKILRIEDIVWNLKLETINYINYIMQIAINSLLKTLKIRARNKNIIIEFKKKNFSNLVKRRDSFEKILRKISLITYFYCCAIAKSNF